MTAGLCISSLNIRIHAIGTPIACAWFRVTNTDRHGAVGWTTRRIGEPTRNGLDLREKRRRDSTDRHSCGEDSMKLKVTWIAVAGLLAVFLTAEIAQAGLTGSSRLRPGKGFHNNSKRSSMYTRSSRSWNSPRRSYSTQR